MSSQPSPLPTLVTVPEAKALAAAGAVFVDATYFAPSEGQDAAGAFAGAHLPDALFFDIDGASRPGSALPHMLPDAAGFEAFARGAGLPAGQTLIVYDRIRLRSAPRAWWTLRAFGARDVAILDGGLEAWAAAGLPVASGMAAPAQGDFVATAQPGMIADLDAVIAAAQTGDHLILDARPAARFTGAEGDGWTSRKGHIRGSVNLPASTLLDAQGRLRPLAELEARIAPLLDARPIITTCGSGIAAAILALALDRIGRRDVALFDGSWAEWGQSPRTEALTTLSAPAEG